MKPSKQPVFAALSLATIAGVSGAEAPRLRTVSVPIEASAIPARCDLYSTMPADTRSELVPWNQRLSLASCLQPEQVYVAEPSVRGIGELVVTITRDMEPSLILYRDVFARAPDEARILASYGTGRTYVDIMVRARRAIDLAAAYGGATYGNAFERSRFLHAEAELLLVPHRVEAVRAFREVVRMAGADPALATKNEVIATAIASSRNQINLLEADVAPDTNTTTTAAW